VKEGWEKVRSPALQVEAAVSTVWVLGSVAIYTASKSAAPKRYSPPKRAPTLD